MCTKPFLRQLLLCSGPWSLYFMLGLSTGLPTVLIPQLRRSNITISDETASWLPASDTYSGIPWVILLSVLTIAIGRKRYHVIACISSLIGFIVLFFSTEISHFFIATLFYGSLNSAHLTTSVVILTECVSPKYRGLFLTLKSVIFFWGILTSNAIGTFFHWQNIAILGMVCAVYTLINVVFWPESPLWLASKGKFKECAAAHRWLKGNDKESEKELNKLLKSHESKRIVKDQWTLRKLIQTLRQKQFIKPILLSNLLVCLYCFSGKLVCIVYAIDILKKFTASESSAYSGMLILDGVTVFSMYIGCFASRLMRRRVILIGFSTLGILFLILISGYLYLVKFSVISENKYISIALLAGYSISISCGPMIMSISIIGELLPLMSRILSMCIVALCFKLINGTFLKISPFIFKSLSMPGTFTLYSILSIVSLILVYFFLPETKDKTLQEIDDCVKGLDVKDADENCELIKVNVRNVTQ